MAHSIGTMDEYYNVSKVVQITILNIGLLRKKTLPEIKHQRKYEYYDESP